MFQTLTTVVPKTAVEQAAYSKWLDQTSDREQARLDRISPGTGVIPGPLWLILFVTGGLVALYAFLFADPDEHWLPQVVIAGSLAAMLAVSLLVIQFLNNPYTPGTGTLKPTEMQHVLAEIAGASAKLGDPSRGSRVTRPACRSGAALSSRRAMRRAAASAEALP